MNTLSSNPRLRPPSPSPRRSSHRPTSSLTLRTTDSHSSPAMAQATPSSASSLSQSMNYPIPIPPAKMPKAVRLYRTWRTEEALAQRDAASPADYEDNPYLHIPNTPTARSRTSGGSSGHNGTSLSASMYDATDMTSVVSFDSSPSTANELTTFNGARVRQRVRRRFDPVGKARTALVRWLGSCPRCRERRVPCPLEEHHDIATLNRLHTEGSVGEVVDPLHRSRSSGSSSSQRTARSRSGQQQQDTAGASHTNFLGIGQNPQLLQPYSSTDAQQHDVQSPGGMADPLAGITAPPSFTNIQFDPAVQPRSEPIIRDQGSLLFVVGRQIGLFYTCEDLGGCPAYYDDVAELQTHFEARHFPFRRLEQPLAHSCYVCHSPGADPSSPCLLCGSALETWILGEHFRVPTFYTDPADGPTPMSSASSSTPYHPVVHPPQNADTEWQQGPSGGFRDADLDPFTDNTPNHNSYNDTGTMEYRSNLFDGPGLDGSQGNGSRSARQVAFENSSCRAWYSDAIHSCQRRKLWLLFFLLMVVIVFSFTYDRMISKSPASLSLPKPEHHDHLPKVGFIMMFASFSMSLFVKRISLNTPSPQLVSGSPFRTYLPYTTRRGRFGPHPHIQCTGYL